MFSHEDVQTTLDLVELIHSVRGRDELFPLLCRGIEHLFKCTSVIFVPYNPKSGHFQFTGNYLHNSDPSVLLQYILYYAPMDPFITSGWIWDPLAPPVATYEDCVELAKLETSEFFREFLLKVPMRYCLGLKFVCQGDMLGVLGIHRRKELGPFGARERALGEFLVPHLSKVLHRFAFLESMDVFVQTETGVLILEEPEARLIYANAAAIQILGPQFSGTLSLLGKGNQPVFFQGSQGFHRVRSFPLQTAFPGSLPFGINVSSDSISGRFLRVVLLEPTVLPPARDHRMDEQGLSPRQKEITRLVMQGCPNREIADKLKITEQTVKDHLHDIYEKLGVKNRCSLIARFSDPY